MKIYPLKHLGAIAIASSVFLLLLSCGRSSEEDQQQYKPVASNCLEAASLSDPATTISLCLQEAYQGNLLAEVALGEVYEKIQDWEHAAQWYQMAATHGDLHSQYQLAKLYLERKGDLKDIRIALGWLLESAKAGYTASQLTLAKLYQQGNRLEKNDYLAYQWYAACAEKEPDAALELGLAYLTGKLGQKRDLDLGIRYLSYAAKQNNPKAKVILTNLIAEAKRNENTGKKKKSNIQQRETIATIDQMSETAKTGSAEEQLTLAKELMQYSIPQYDKAALHWVMKAAMQGNEEAKYWLALCYLEGIGTEIEYDKAFAIFSEMALLGYPMAQFQLGKMYYEGKGIDQDNDLGRKWIQQAAEQGVEEATTMLAILTNDEASENDDENADENL